MFLLTSPPYSFSHTTIGTFGLVGVVGALAAARAGILADRGLGQWTTGLALALLILAWLMLALTPWSILWLVLGVVALDLGAQGFELRSFGVADRGLARDGRHRLLLSARCWEPS